MQLANTARSYGWISISLHWSAAGGVVAMIVIGLMAGQAADAGDRARQFALLGLHISLGVTLATLLLVRVLAYYLQRQPDPAPQAATLKFVAAATHHLLLFTVLILMASGPLQVWSAGYPVSVWGLFSIPNPFGGRSDYVHDLAEIAHLVGRYMLYVLVPLHVLGALKHLLFDRDRVFQRMLRPASE